MTQKKVLYLGPFQGITYALYRNAFHKYFGGIDVFFAPFVAGLTGEKVNPAKIRDLMPSINRDICLVPQILSKNSREIILLSKTLKDLGYEVLNWNLGCPFAKVADKKRGSGMLPYPEMIRKILEEAIPACPTEISVKMRTGYHSHEEAGPVMDVLADFPIREIILHPRTGTQEYGGFASREAFSGVAGKSRHPLVYNGDIFSPDDFRKISESMNRQAYMLGRGALYFPFLPSLIKGTLWPLPRRKEALHGFLQHMTEGILRSTQGRTQLTDKLKPVWYCLSFAFEDSIQVWRKIRKTNIPEAFPSLADEILENYPLRLTPLSYQEFMTFSDQISHA